MWEPVEVGAGADAGHRHGPGPGLRTYLAVRGGFDVPTYLGSASTFTLGGFGGHARSGPARRRRAAPGLPGLGRPAPGVPVRHAARAWSAGRPRADRRTALTDAWEIAVTEGPHAAPDFFTRADLDVFYATDYDVHHNSARTGVRLIGPRPDVGADGRRRGRPAPLEHPRHPLRGRRDRLHRRHPDHPGTGRAVARRLRLPRGGRQRRPVEAGPAPTGRHRPVRPRPRGRRRRARRAPAPPGRVPRTGGDGDDGVLAPPGRDRRPTERRLPTRRRRQRARRVRRHDARHRAADARARAA